MPKSRAFDHSKYNDWIDPNEVVPYEKNAKLHDEKQVRNIANSIKRFGWQQDTVITSDNVLVIGHGRRLAALKLGCEMPYHRIDKVADELTDADIRELRIADNQTNAETGFDTSMMNLEIADLEFEGFDFDFDVGDGGAVAEDDIVEDDFEAVLPETPITKRGDIWKLGNHILMCGDSTDVNDIAKLMNGDKAKMLFTSPPYSDMREYEGGKDLSVANLAQFISAYRPYTDYQCVNLGIQRKNNEIIPYWDEYTKIAHECGYKMLAWNVWDKLMCGSIGQQSAFFPIRHEWVFVYGTEFYEINLTWEKKPESIHGPRKRAVRQADGSFVTSTKGDETQPYKQMESVLPLYAELGEIRALHPATFPVDLPGEYIKAMTVKDDIVIEPFGGSGTTLIACEVLNRRCRIMELEPKYCDVIIKRFEDFTRLDGVLLNG